MQQVTNVNFSVDYVLIKDWSFQYNKVFICSTDVRGSSSYEMNEDLVNIWSRRVETMWIVLLTKKLSAAVYKSTTGYSEFILESVGHDLIYKEIQISLISNYERISSNQSNTWKAVHQPCRLVATINFLSSSKLCAKSSSLIDWLKFAVSSVTRSVVMSVWRRS